MGLVALLSFSIFLLVHRSETVGDFCPVNIDAYTSNSGLEFVFSGENVYLYKKDTKQFLEKQKIIDLFPGAPAKVTGAHSGSGIFYLFSGNQMFSYENEADSKKMNPEAGNPKPAPNGLTINAVIVGFYWELIVFHEGQTSVFNRDWTAASSETRTRLLEWSKGLPKDVKGSQQHGNFRDEITVFVPNWIGKYQVSSKVLRGFVSLKEYFNCDDTSKQLEEPKCPSSIDAFATGQSQFGVWSGSMSYIFSGGNVYEFMSGTQKILATYKIAARFPKSNGSITAALVNPVKKLFYLFEGKNMFVYTAAGSHKQSRRPCTDRPGNCLTESLTSEWRFKTVYSPNALSEAYTNGAFVWLYGSMVTLGHATDIYDFEFNNDDTHKSEITDLISNHYPKNLKGIDDPYGKTRYNVYTTTEVGLFDARRKQVISSMHISDYFENCKAFDPLWIEN